MSLERRNSIESKELPHDEEYYLREIQNGMALKDVPEDMRSDKVYLAACRQNGKVLGEVPEGRRNDEICLAAVQQYGEALGNVPEEKRTEIICLAACRQNGEALGEVPKGIRTEIICLTACRQNGEALGEVPKGIRTEEIYLAACQQNGMALRFVPRAERTEIICLAACQQKGKAIKHVLEDKRTDEICLAACRRNGMAIKFIREHMLTEEMCLAGVQQDWEAIKYVPEHLKEKMKEKLNHFLSEVRHIVIVDEREKMNPEVILGSQVYATKEKRENKTISVTINKLDDLMSNLRSCKNPHDLELVLIGHYNLEIENDVLAGVTPKGVVSCLEKYPNIIKVKLLGCHTASKNADAAHPHSAEMRELDGLRHESKDEEVPENCSLFYMEDSPTADQRSKLLKKQNTVFIVYEKAGTKNLMKLEKENENINQRTTIINDNQYGFYTKSHKKIQIPKGSFSALLKIDDNKRKQLMPDLLGQSGYISKNDPLYANYKSTHPSERSLNIEWGKESENYFVKNSFIRMVLEEIESNKNISRPIKVKAYPGGVYVDHRQGCFHSAKQNLYVIGRKVSIFHDNILREKLKEARENKDFKSFTVTIVPGRQRP